jgi:translation initiation factor IF-3
MSTTRRLLNHCSRRLCQQRPCDLSVRQHSTVLPGLLCRPSHVDSLFQQPNVNTLQSALLGNPFYAATRKFAVSKRGKQPDAPLVNGQLVSVLMRRTGTTSIENIQVRVVRDTPTESEEKSSTELVSLGEAMRMSVELDQDLIGISTELAVPVVRIDKLNSFLYKKSRKIKKATKTKSLDNKQFRFKAGIADNDLERKTQQMIKLLSKGYNCEVTVQCKHWEVNPDRHGPDYAVKTVERVLLQLEDSAELMNPPKFLDARKIMAKFKVYPSSKLKKTLPN